MMKKLGAAILAAAMCLTLFACNGGDNGSKDGSDVAYIKEKRTLVVGITDFAPMDYKDDKGEWIGFDADMARKIGESLGVDVQFTVIDWDNKLIELENKSVDCLWNGMTITEDIKKGASPTNAYAKNAQVVVVKSEVADKYKDKESLKELTFAVEDGSAGQEAAQAEGLKSNGIKDQAAALMEVNAGTSEACIIDLLMAGAMIGEGTSYPNLVSTVELTEEDYGVACRTGSDLTEYINEQFKKLYADGSMMQLAEKYGIAQNIIEQK